MTDNTELLAVSSPPFWHSGRTLKQTLLTQIIVLLPVACMAIIMWGWPALRVLSLAVSTCIFTEVLCQKMMQRPLAVDNFSAVLIGLLFAFLLPATVPWWLVVLGAFLSISLGKMAFGDLGAAPLCAPLVGYVLCFISFPTLMDPNAMLLNTHLIDPLFRSKFFGAHSVDSIPLVNLLLGQQIGGLGASQVGLVFLGGILACLRGVVRWEIPAAFLAGVFVTALCFQSYNPTLYASPFFHLLTGTTLLGAFFLATDMSSSPNKQLNMVIYGALGGILVVLIRNFGIYTDGVPFAILLINLIMPLLESKKQIPFGYVKIKE